MSNRITPEKINAIAWEYCNNGFKKVQCLKTLGYSKNYAEHVGLKIFDNDRIKQAIARITTKNAVNSAITVQTLQSDLQTIHDLAINKGDLATAARCKELQGKTIAAFTDNLNTQDNTKHEELERIEQEEAKRIAEIRLKTG